MNYIEMNPQIRFGKPTIKGTRIAISDILNWLASGMTNEEILADYPKLEIHHIHAALFYAAHREEIIKSLVAYNETSFRCKFVLQANKEVECSIHRSYSC